MKSKISLFLLIVLLSFYSTSIYAEQKNLDVSVIVVDSIDSQDNYLSLDNFGSSEGGTGNQAEEVKESSLLERGISPQYLKKVGELASSRASNQWFFPVILIIFAIVLIIIYFLRNKWKRKKKIIIKRKLAVRRR